MSFASKTRLNGRRRLGPALRFVGFIIGLTLLGGCRWMNDDKGIFVNRGDDYMTLEERDSLLVPSDLYAGKVVDPYPIPRTPELMNPEYYPTQPPRPDAIFANNNRDEVRIQRLGERAWLVVPESPTTVWPKVKQFLAENGVRVASEVSQYGRLDTVWLDTSRESYSDLIRSLIRTAKEQDGLLEGKDRLLIGVEPGLREGTSEIYVRHENDTLGLPSSGVVDLNTLRSVNPSVELDALNQIGGFIAAKVSEQTVSMVALDMTTQVKSSLERDANGITVLELRVDYDRAWATVGQALARAEADVENLDQVEGVYTVRIRDEILTGEQKGWISGLFSRGKNGYFLQLHVTAAADAICYVTVFDGEAGPVDREVGQQVLSMLREFAS
jgi:outer membrane protein assembly factor BamC